MPALRALLTPAFFATSACSSAALLRVSSSTPARVEMNGKTVCASTPCEVHGNADQSLMGDQCLSGLKTPLDLYPLDKTKGYHQYKQVEAKCNETAEVYFDLTDPSAEVTVRARE